jgi:hypothetical protein
VRRGSLPFRYQHSVSAIFWPTRRRSSKTDGRARFAPHTAFTDPTAPPDAPPRESIEVRALLFHRA